MDIDKKGRTELKAYFVKNAIPTQSNFAELVDAALNQKDDGIVKLAGNPLSIEAAAGAVATEKKALNLYESFADTSPAWVLSLTAGAAASPLGFGVSDGAGNLRLFIDRSSGNVGVSTANPADRLTVAGGDVRITGGRHRRLNIVSDTYWAGIELVAREDGEAGHPHIDFTHGDLGAPNFGVRLYAPDNDQLSVTGGLTVDGNVGIGTNPTIDLAIGDSDTGLKQQGDGNLAIMTDNKERVRINALGNVGIGTASPTQKLHVAGYIQATGILFGDGTVQTSKPSEIGGYRFAKFLAGAISVNETPASTGSVTKTITFASAFGSTPMVIVTAMNGNSTNYPDTFAVTIRSRTTTSCKVNIQRVDLAGAWVPTLLKLELAWMAWTAG